MIEIHIIGTTNSGKTTICKIIAKALAVINIPVKIIDEFDFPIHYQTETFECEMKKIIAVQKKYQTENPIVIKTVQCQKGRLDDNRSFCNFEEKRS